MALVPEDGIEDHEKVAHRSGEGKLAGTAAVDAALVEGGADGMVADGGERGHVQHLRHRHPAAIDRPTLGPPAGYALSASKTRISTSVVLTLRLRQRGSPPSFSDASRAKSRSDRVTAGLPRCRRTAVEQ